jgi:hypothetical protein
LRITRVDMEPGFEVGLYLTLGVAAGRVDAYTVHRAA